MTFHLWKYLVLHISFCCSAEDQMALFSCLKLIPLSTVSYFMSLPVDREFVWRPRFQNESHQTRTRRYVQGFVWQSCWTLKQGFEIGLNENGNCSFHLRKLLIYVIVLFCLFVAWGSGDGSQKDFCLMFHDAHCNVDGTRMSYLQEALLYISSNFDPYPTSSLQTEC